MLLRVSLCLRQLLFQNRDAGFQLTNFVDQTSRHLQEDQARDERLHTAGPGRYSSPHLVPAQIHSGSAAPLLQAGVSQFQGGHLGLQICIQLTNVGFHFGHFLFCLSGKRCNISKNICRVCSGQGPTHTSTSPTFVSCHSSSMRACSSW